MNKIRFLVVSVILAAGIAISFGLPKPKYKGLDILSRLAVPGAFGDWQSKDISQSIKLEDDRYNFASNIIARQYTHKSGASLMFLVLDAGNFHNPKVCFGSSGFKIKEIGDKDFTIAGRALKARALFVERGREGFLLVYWMCIDKKRVDWLEQKAKQFFYSLINKKKAGFMVRIDAPADEKNIPAALAMIQEFIGGIVSRMPAGQADYIFGS